MQKTHRGFWAAASILAAIGILSATLAADHIRELSALSAAMVLGTAVSYKPAAPTPPESTVSEAHNASSEPESPSSDASSSVPSSAAPSVIAGKVKENDLSKSGNIYSGNVRITSKSSSKIDVAQLLAADVELSLTDTLEPQVLIYHTHTTEGYMTDFTGTYTAADTARTSDPSRNVVGVGDIITEKLNAAGIVAIHDTQVYDSPAYTGAYSRSLKTIEAYMKQYPTIQVVLDVHRDAIQENDGTLLKPTALINGKKAAQIMLVSGCDDNGTLGFPNWRKNLTFAAHLQQQLANDYPSLARPVYCRNIRYNGHVSPAAILVEFGSDSNTADEAMYSAELFADSLIALLQNYLVK